MKQVTTIHPFDKVQVPVYEIPVGSSSFLSCVHPVTGETLKGFTIVSLIELIMGVPTDVNKSIRVE